MHVVPCGRPQALFIHGCVCGLGYEYVARKIQAGYGLYLAQKQQQKEAGLDAWPAGGARDTLGVSDHSSKAHAGAASGAPCPEESVIAGVGDLVPQLDAPAGGSTPEPFKSCMLPSPPPPCPTPLPLPAAPAAPNAPMGQWTVVPMHGVSAAGMAANGARRQPGQLQLQTGVNGELAASIAAMKHSVYRSRLSRKKVGGRGVAACICVYVCKCVYENVGLGAHPILGIIRL